MPQDCTLPVAYHSLVFYWCYLLLLFCSLANYPDEVIDSLPESLETGVYYGWASLAGNEVYKMVLSVGWNPFFKNTKKSMVGMEHLNPSNCCGY